MPRASKSGGKAASRPARARADSVGRARRKASRAGALHRDSQPVAGQARAAGRPPAGQVATPAADGREITDLLDSANIAAVLLGPDQTVRRFTPAARKLFRLGARDLGRTLAMVRARFADPEFASDVAAVLREHRPREREVFAEDRRWYLLRIAPYRALHNHGDGVTLSFREVTPLKRTQEQLRALAGELEQRVARRTSELKAEVRERWDAEETLRAERNFVDAILGTASALIVVLDTQGRIVRFNKACENVTGLSFEEIKGQSWQVLVPEEERGGVSSVFQALRMGVYPSRFENHWRHKDGSQRLIAWSNTCLLDAYGALQYVVATGVDITGQRRAEREALQRQAEVAQLHRLHAVGELAALLAHELNQPLAAIASYGEASLGQLERNEDGDRLRRNLEQMVEQAQRASRSIRELRQFLAKDQPERTPTALGAVLRAACGLVEALARARGVRLHCGADEALPRVMAQAMQVEHVIVNLLQNALDAIRDAGMAQGSVTVRVRRDAPQSVQVSVEDSGPGIDAELAEKVFEPLYTTKTDGLGLGLSICRSLIEAQGGRIWAERGPGGKFHFTLPVAT